MAAQSGNILVAAQSRNILVAAQSGKICVAGQAVDSEALDKSGQGCG